MAKARKEIDKDSMYQKIMPSAMRSAQPEEEAAPAAKKAPARSTPRKAPAKPAAVEADEVLEEDDIPDESPTPRKAVPSQKPVPPQKSTASTADAKSDIVNIMQLLIDEKIDVAMEKFHCCTCDKCRQDITAMALNKLHPKYIIAEPEELETAMADKDANTQVTTALVQAILKVKANPKH